MEHKTRKSAKTQERIVTCAAELMTERGSATFKMSEVSQNCNMSKGALYYYFSDKDDLVDAVFDREMDEVVGLVNSALSNGSTALDSLRNLCTEFGHRATEGPILAMALIHDLSCAASKSGIMDTRFQTMITNVADTIQASINEGSMRADVNPYLSSISLCGALCFAALNAKSEKGLPEDFIDVLLAQALNGIGA
ncbi:MAG: TetR/AcrR family transcriptional regulator [Coriobacteriales bacterium]|nr:TetR/AcrR family transcriptional regulator [Coriobacteriales bacterium]